MNVLEQLSREGETGHVVQTRRNETGMKLRQAGGQLLMRHRRQDTDAARWSGRPSGFFQMWTLGAIADDRQLYVEPIGICHGHATHSDVEAIELSERAVINEAQRTIGRCFARAGVATKVVG